MVREAGSARPPEADPPGLAVADAARRVGVATSTLRAWERRYGLGPSSRTRGGHRRYTTSDVATLQRLERLVATGMPTAEAAVRARQPAPAPTTHRGGRDSAARRFALASDALDSARLARAADAALIGSGAMHAWLDVFAPQLRTLGTRWECTGNAVEREHLTSSAVHAALAGHTARHWPRQPSGGMVLAAATATEEHTLPLFALAAALAEVRIRTCVLAGLPLGALHTAIADVVPTVVVLWSHTAATSDVPALRSVLTRAPVTCAAGLGWPVASLPPGVAHLTGLPAAVDTMTVLLG